MNVGVRRPRTADSTCQATNSAAIDLGDTAEVDDSDESGGDATDAPDGEEAIDRAPISPLIEGDTSDLNVAEVTRRDLVLTKTFAATLGYGDLRPFPTNTSGVVTTLPAEGDTIAFGEVLFAVDGQPVVLLEGDIPQYRPFDLGMAGGADVEQLQRNLVALGYADPDLTVDGAFTLATRDAVEAMQRQLGADGQLQPLRTNTSGIVTALHEIPYGKVWPRETIATRQDEIATEVNLGRKLNVL